MARGHAGEENWEEDDLLYSGRDSDDSPILSYRHDRSRRYPSYAREGKAEEHARRSTLSVLAKCFLFSTAMILFCVLLYIPVYNKANDQVVKPAVAGWSIHANRDTKIYVQPENVTTIHEPKDICPKTKEKNKLLLLIIVCSSTVNFQERQTIRETWGNYKSYLKLKHMFKEVAERFKNFNTTLILEARLNASIEQEKNKKIASYIQLLPELARIAQSNSSSSESDSSDEKRFDDEKLSEFDMNKVLGDQYDTTDFDDYGSNIMKIPPKGYEEIPDMGRVMAILRHAKAFPKIESPVPTEPPNTVPDFKLVFLLGVPAKDNSSDTQEKIDEESETYSDIIQENFVDSYNNLTLKSIMMLKWVTNNCNESVRYILKTDDDMYVNLPKLVANLRSRAQAFDNSTKEPKPKEYLLIGDLICGARPVQDSKSKWYSPRYMYAGRMYPRYLSGTGYVISTPAVRALYAAALTTPYFHLEDIFITGMCALRANPRLTPRDEQGFSYFPPRGNVVCSAYSRINTHHLLLKEILSVHKALQQTAHLDKCESRRLLEAKLASLPAVPTGATPNDQKRKRFYRTPPRCK